MVPTGLRSYGIAIETPIGLHGWLSSGKTEWRAQ
jgi:hypothetical protein